MIRSICSLVACFLLVAGLSAQKAESEFTAKGAETPASTVKALLEKMKADVESLEPKDEAEKADDAEVAQLDEEEEIEYIDVWSWDKEVVNLGAIDHNKPVKVAYPFTNTSEEPIIITKAKGSCGCTDIVYPEAPIMPGETAEIVATYDASDFGPFTKLVTVYTTQENVKPVVLKMNGEVVLKF